MDRSSHVGAGRAAGSRPLAKPPRTATAYCTGRPGREYVLRGVADDPERGDLDAEARAATATIGAGLGLSGPSPPAYDEREALAPAERIEHARA